ncbi:AbrB family transcriptional regulator (stage V sporulation protein T) [Salirhabdus euzebyi]|uniref:AbrB family transcriptional regulator (Stage V sporulation protein T) n=1 Tax=Salirhabdus euzebyi TaxID=394506 RepID=A0A841Q1L4_9BACI|nr:AbrB/MazE/SpoVT family DNA-binding domain-containing protein [Salirhabdus euzebyi]MBB6452012.1 AbrB family transcriptional regulator (stage V sporulation protein T) [Salirhabdus euzebyi]
MPNAIGIVRRMDDLGRVVIPIEVRRAHGWESGTPLEMLASDEGIVVRKYKSNHEKEQTLNALKSLLPVVNGRATKNVLEQVISYVEAN